MNVPPVTLSVHVMATRFELALYGDDPVRLRAAGEEALREIERLEAQLSFYQPDSEIRWINTHAGESFVKVEPRLLRLLKDCAALTALTDGAFDVTVGPLMRAWRFVGDTGQMPTPAELDAARSVVGVDKIRLDEDAFTVAFERQGVEIDLGAYGKGYAIERAIELLKENGIASALLHGGTSSVHTIGTPPGDSSWKIALHEPLTDGDRQIVIDLADSALSVSAIHGKAFEAEGRKYGHVIDPRSGFPVSRALAAAVAGPSPSVCEALSTALLVLGATWLPVLAERFPGYEGLVAFEAESEKIAVARSNP